MNNYYDILEVSQKASSEVIEKAYKVLAKKYHPDLQEESNKSQAEQKMKLINEAYEILSNEEKRKEYDGKLEQYKRQQESIQNNQNQNYYNNDEYYEEKRPLTKEEIKAQMKEERRAQREYQEQQEALYRRYLRSLGYRVKERWTLKRFIKLLKVIGVLLIIILILWIFPPTHKIMLETYESNHIVKALTDIIISIFKGIGQGLVQFFKSIFGIE